MTKIYKYPVIICFSVFLLTFFLSGFLIKDKEVSEWENRYLTQKPSVNVRDIMDGSFMEKYESYVNDQMPLRDGFIRLKAISEAILLKIENNGIARGKDSYLFTKNTNDASVFDKNISIISEFVKKIDNPVIVAIAPNACGILYEKMPEGFMVPDQRGKLSQIYSDNSLLKDATVVDLKSALDAHGDEYIYYRTDHHWTTLGAYYAYREVSNKPVDISDIETSIGANYSDSFLGTLYAKYKGLFVKSDVITYYDIPVKKYTTDDTERNGLIDYDKFSVFDKYGAFMWGNFGKCEIVTETENGKRAVIFKDSYANSLIPFLTYDYEYITVIDLRYLKQPVSEIMAENESADVLFIHNFDFVNEDNHFYKLMK